MLVYYGQEARMYTLLVLLATTTALAVVGLVEPGAPRGRLKLLGVYIVAGLAALYTHYFAGFALLGLGLYWLYAWARSGGNRRRLGEFLTASLVIVLGYLPWLPVMLQRLRGDSSYWAGALKLGEALLDAAINFGVGATETMREADAVAWLPWIGLVALLWLAAVGFRTRRGVQRPLALLVLWGALPVALILALAYRTPKFNPRYLLVSWPVWALLVGGGVSSLWRGGRLRWPQRLGQIAAIVSLGLLLTTHLVGLRNWFTDPSFAKTAWREAMTEMYRHRQPDETVLLVSGHAYPIFDVYLPDFERYRLPELDILDVNQVLGWEETAAALNRDLAGKGGVWLFLWQNEVVDPANVTTTLLDRYADPLPVPSFGFIDLRHYRLRPGERFPDRPSPPVPGADFGGLLRLNGIEPAPGGLWLYWSALQPDLPDLKVALTVRDASGQEIIHQDTRPVGYPFPTTRWQVGETYPVWLPVAPAENLRLEMVVYEAETGRVIAQTESPTPFSIPPPSTPGAFQFWGHFSLCHGTSRPVGARHSSQSRDRSGVYLAMNPDIRAPIAWECLAPTTPDDTPPI